MKPSLRRRLAVSPPGAWWHKRRDLAGLRAWSALDDRRLAFYSDFLRAGDLAFDIGANIGNRTKIFRRLGARVVALEPQPYCQAVLKQAFRNDSQVTIVPAAAGREEGTAEIKIASGHGVSSLSPQWIGAVTESHRFSTVSWDRAVSCSVTTVDRLMATYGLPSFIKIDVEGYELQVIEGMHSPVAALSFEYTPEFRPAAFACIERLEAMGMVQFSYSPAESMQLAEAWCDKAAIKGVLSSIADAQSFGDVYARTPRA